MRIATTIDDFDAADLDALTGDCLFGSQLLSFVELEHRERAEILYFYEERDGRLEAFAPGYVYRDDVPLTFRLGDFVGDAASRDGVRAMRSHLVVGVPIRLRSRIFATDDEGIRNLTRDIVGWARDEGLSAVVLPFVLGSDASLRAHLQDEGFASAFYEGDFYLPISGATMDEFLQSIPRGPRKRFVNDMNHFTQSGLGMQPVTAVASYADTLADLHKSLMDRYSRPAVEFTRESFVRFERQIRDRHVLVTTAGDRVVGFSISIAGSGVMHVLRYGRDDTAEGDARIYANLGYVEPVRWAVAQGLDRVHFGKAAHRAKTLRGCLYEEGIVYALCLDSDDQAEVEVAFKQLDTANRERFAALCAGS